MLCRLEPHKILPYKIVEYYKFELYIKSWVPNCITVPNFMKIGLNVAEI